MIKITNITGLAWTKGYKEGYKPLSKRQQQTIARRIRDLMSDMRAKGKVRVI